MGLNACIDEYFPDVDKYENLLVVDGMITNEPGPYTINLSFSNNLQSDSLIPYSDCRMTISDDLGNFETLNEVEPGVYKTSASGIQGIIGRKYKLQLITPEDKTYESEFEELLKPTGIQDVYGEIESKENPDELFDQIGYQFYVDTEIAENPESFFLWRAEATYEYHSDFTIRWIFDGELNWFYDNWKYYYCWKTYYVDDFYLFSTKNISEAVATRFALNYVNTETRELSVKYSLMVNQYSISETAYEFWSAVREQTAEQGALFAHLPYQVQGNMLSTNDNDASVLGYFLVAGVSNKRIFVDRPPPNIPMYYTVCVLDEGDFHSYGQMWMADPVLYPLYAIESPGGRRATPSKYCTDCRTKGGTIEKPEFWID